jgi:3-oxoadipate enol-lactonase
MKLEIDGGSVAFETAGAGPALLFLHAFPLSSTMWTATVAALRDHHQVITVDARGFGGSDLSRSAMTMDLIASDAAAVLDHLGVAQAVLVGCSMGGYAAFAFARRFAARLRGLVLVDTRAPADSDEARAGRATLAQKVLAQGPAVLAEAMLPKLLGATSHRERPELVDQVRAWVLEAKAEAIANALQAMGARPDSRGILGRLAVPTLVIRGEEDVICTPDDAREMEAGIAGSRLATLPQSGHLPNLETPARFEPAVSAFLSNL